MRLSLGDVVSSTASVLASSLPSCFAAALLFTAPAVLLDYWIDTWRFAQYREALHGDWYGADEDELLRVGVIGLGISGLAGAFAIAATQAGVLYTVVERLAGRRPSFGEGLVRTIRRMPAAIGAMVLVSCAVLFSGSCFGVPAVVLAGLFYFAVPAAVVEDLPPFKAVARSVDLTHGNRLMILALVFTIVCAFAALRIAARAAFGAPPLIAWSAEDVTTELPPWGYHVAMGLATSLEAMILAVLSSVMYARLRQRDGIDLAKLTEIFE